jgi:alkylhydroperoxidase/carboxymuconolactone decarboxylase family protein YurZ
MNRKIAKGKKKVDKKGVDGGSVINLLRESLRGYVIPEFDRGAKSDPEFFEMFIKLPRHCLRDGKALPAKYRLMINMCLLAHVGHLRGIPHYIKTAIEEHGATKLEIIEAFETAMLAGGVPTMIRGLAGLLSYEESKKGKS